MKVIFRVDASVEIGTGHVMRCLTLAESLREAGASILFVSRELPGNLCDFIGGKGFAVHRLAEPSEVPLASGADAAHAGWLGVGWEKDVEDTIEVLRDFQEPSAWLIVDNYALDARWEKLIRPYVRRIMVIDDLADRPHDCDLLLDQNLYEDMESRYEGLVPVYCRKLLGPGNALLRPEFLEARKNLRQRDGSIRRILIFFGGSDSSNETTKALLAWKSINRTDIAVDVVVGTVNPCKEQVSLLCATMENVTYHCNVNTMAQMMASSDLAIGAGGSTTWERCFLGLSTITLVLALNQAETTAALARRGAAWNLGWYEDVDASDLAAAILRALYDPLKLRDMSQRAQSLMGEKSLERASLLTTLILEGQNA